MIIENTGKLLYDQFQMEDEDRRIYDKFSYVKIASAFFTEEN